MDDNGPGPMPAPEPPRKESDLSSVSWFIKRMSQDYLDCAIDKMYCEIVIDFTYYSLYGGIFIILSIIYYFSYAYRQYRHKCKMNVKFSEIDKQNKLYKEFAK